MPGSIETSSTYGELVRGVGVRFGSKKKRSKGKSNKSKPKRVGYLSYEK